MIADRPDVAGHFATVEEVFRVVFAIAMVALLVSRLVLATRPRRRILAPVYVVGCAWIAVFGLFGAIRYFAVTEQRLIGHARLVPDGNPRRSAACVRSGASARTDLSPAARSRR